MTLVPLSIAQLFNENNRLSGRINEERKDQEGEGGREREESLGTAAHRCEVALFLRNLALRYREKDCGAGF
jgi:hypothetical protein